ncbi:MAG: hypothetical protein ACRDKB_10720 [Actinomycetota bacterium]
MTQSSRHLGVLPRPHPHRRCPLGAMTMTMTTTMMMTIQTTAGARIAMTEELARARDEGKARLLLAGRIL